MIRFTAVRGEGEPIIASRPVLHQTLMARARTLKAFYHFGEYLLGFLRSASYLSILAVGLSTAWGQLPQGPESLRIENLTEAEFAALERATEASVTGTISFLASDELAGRGTPSNELTIATAYVASRLRAAGVEGLGPDGSYYLESQVDTVLTPKCENCVTTVGEAQRVTCTMLNGVDTDYAYSGKIKLFGEQGPAAVENNDPIAIHFEGSSQPVMVALMNQVRSLSKTGAGAIVLLVPETSELWQVAVDRQTRPSIESPRRRLTMPIVLVKHEDYDPEKEYRLRIPAQVKAKAVVRNVVGVLRGSDAKLTHEAIVFSAHLDHLGRGTSQPDPIYNGADDDASGVTAVLTLADIYGALVPRPKRSLIFTTFWGEERGLLGSKALVENSPWPLDKIVANINIEMIGRPEEGAVHKMWMTGWDKSDLGELVAIGSRRMGVETFEHPSYSARLYGASDNASFVNKGVIAHSFSAGSLHSDYHQPSDEWQKLNLPHMTQVIRGLYAGTLPIARGMFTPAIK